MPSLNSHAPVVPRYLVIQLARFGDLIQTKRLVRSLARRGEVHLLVDRSLLSLACLVYPDVLVHGIAAHGAHGRDISTKIHADLAAIAGQNFTRIFNLNFSGLNFALAAMFPSDRVRGYGMRMGQRLIDAWPALAMRWTRHRAETGINLVDMWGLLADEPIASTDVNPAPCPSGGGLGVVMAGQNARRSLPPTILAPLVQAALQRVGRGPVFLLGAGAERRAAMELISLLPPAVRGEVRDRVGRTDWAALADTVAGLDLLLTPDTGTMHLAAHLGTPVLAFFLSSAWCHETGPYGAGHMVLQSLPACAPCVETTPCPHGTRCSRPFTDPAVLRFVSGREEKPVPGDFAVMRSEFDVLGVVFRAVSGRDPYLQSRVCFRSMAAAVAGVGGITGCVASGAHEWWIQERDWMLPQTLRGRHV